MKNIILLISLLIVFKLNAQPGSFDKNFGDNGIVISKYASGNYGIALQHTGKIITCGLTVKPVLGSKLARYNIDGSLDSSFGVNGLAILNSTYDPAEFRAVAVLDNDEIITVGNGTDIFVAKYTAEGKLDSGFGKNGIAQDNLERFEGIFAVTIQQDGKILVAGDHSTDLYNNKAIVVRYLPNGTLDKSFGSGGQVELPEATGISSLAIQKDKKIVAGGLANVSDDEFYVGRLNEDGTYDKSFGGKGYVYTRFVQDHRDNLNSIVIQNDNKIVAAGVSDLYYGWDMGIARYNTDGSLDNSFGKGGLQSISVPDMAAEAQTVLLQNDGKIILSGRTFDDVKVSSDAMLVRLTTNGIIDSSFAENGIVISDISNGGYDVENGAVLQTDGKILIAGESDFNNNGYDNLARFNNDGSKKQLIITKIRNWLQHHNGLI